MQIEPKSHLHTLIHKIEVVEASWKAFTVSSFKRKFVYILTKKMLHRDERDDLCGVPIIDSKVQQLDKK